MAFSNTILTPPAIPCAAFVKEDSADSFKGCAAILEVGIVLKSSLKQQRFAGVLDSQTGRGGGEVSRRRSVQWIDKLGKELADLREFESRRRAKRMGAAIAANQEDLRLVSCRLVGL